MEKILKKPKAVEIDGKKFVLSKFTVYAGLEIFNQLPSSGLASLISKLDAYKKHEEMIKKVMTFVAIDLGLGNPIVLETDELVESHVDDWRTAVKIVVKMIEYNFEGFQSGRIWIFLEDIARQVPEWVSSMFTRSLEQLLAKSKPPSAN